MDIKGEFRIPLPQDAVWRALNDTEILKASIPGCDELIRESDTAFKGKVSASVGPVRAKFSGQAALSEIDAPNGYTLTGNGSGGAAGMVKGGATVRLMPDGNVTILQYEAHAQVAGKLAQIGSRLVDMAAKKMADEFFGNFVRQLEPAPVEQAPVEPPITAEASVADAVSEIPVAPSQPIPLSAPIVPSVMPQAGSPRRPAWLMWVSVAVAIILLLAYFKGHS